MPLLPSLKWFTFSCWKVQRAFARPPDLCAPPQHSTTSESIQACSVYRGLQCSEWVSKFESIQESLLLHELACAEVLVLTCSCYTSEWASEHMWLQGTFGSIQNHLPQRKFLAWPPRLNWIRELLSPVWWGTSRQSSSEVQKETGWLKNSDWDWNAGRNEWWLLLGQRTDCQHYHSVGLGCLLVQRIGPSQWWHHCSR